MGTKRVDGGAGIRWGNLIPMPEGRAESSGPTTRTLSDLSSLHLPVAQDWGVGGGAGTRPAQWLLCTARENDLLTRGIRRCERGWPS